MFNGWLINFLFKSIDFDDNCTLWLKNTPVGPQSWKFLIIRFFFFSIWNFDSLIAGPPVYIYIYIYTNNLFTLSFPCAFPLRFCCVSFAFPLVFLCSPYVFRCFSFAFPLCFVFEWLLSFSSHFPFRCGFGSSFHKMTKTRCPRRVCPHRSSFRFPSPLEKVQEKVVTIIRCIIVIIIICIITDIVIIVIISL